MNLTDLVHRKDRTLVQGKQLSPAFVDWEGSHWHSLIVAPLAENQIVLRSIDSIYSLSARPHEIGWYARCKHPGAFVHVSLWNESEVSKVRLQLHEVPRPIVLPWPLDGRLVGPKTTLRLHFVLEPNTTADLLIARRLNRKNLIAMARGRGVEIGPGPNPQILPGPTTDVTYVEEATQEKWLGYDASGKYGASSADFSRYHIGPANSLPSQDESLDFIFSSHVFEHLANPIGHLLHWKQKLRDKGVILGVVPDLTSTKDMRGVPSTMDELLDESTRGIWEPTLAHYERYGMLRGRQDADALMRSKTSIHVHFYTAQSMAQLLRECVRKFRFSAYALDYSPNHKDFHFCLWR